MTRYFKNMRSSSKRLMSILLAGVLFIGTLVVYANFIQPEFKKLKDLRSEVYSKERAFNEHKRAVLKVQDLVAKFKGSAQLKETVDMALPAGPNVTQVLGQMHAIARTNQVTITGLSVKPMPFEADKKTLVRRIGKLQIDVIVVGSYDGVKNFTKALETNIRVADVKTMNIQSGRENGSRSSETLAVNLGIQVYYQE